MDYHYTITLLRKKLAKLEYLKWAKPNDYMPKQIEELKSAIALLGDANAPYELFTNMYYGDANQYIILLVDSSIYELQDLTNVDARKIILRGDVASCKLRLLELLK